MSEKPHMATPALSVEAIMTSDVLCVSLTMTIREAIEMVTKAKVSGAPVVDVNHHVISVMSEGDLLKIAATMGLDVKVSSCLERLPKTEKLIVAKRTDSFTDVYKTFLTHSVHRVIVIDANGKVQGIVSRSNILRRLVEGGKPTNESVSKASARK
jgi:predicted transcriptional regulator